VADDKHRIAEILPLPLNLILRVRRIEIHTYEERNESE